MMDFGVVLQTDPPAARVIDLAKRAEAYGFTHAWTFDSHLLWEEPFVIYSRILNETHRLIVGPMVTNPATRDWTVTASLFATLNEMYGNRTICGIGRGDSRGARHQRQARAARRAARRRSASSAAWPTARRSTTRARRCGCRGARRAALPIWVAAYGPKALALTGEVGDGFILQLADPDITAWSIAAVRRAAEAAGRDPDAITICVAAPAYVTDGTRAALAHARDQCRWFGGMVGNHVADIVAPLRRRRRRGPDGADRLHRRARGLRLQRARPRRATRTRRSSPTRSSTASASSARRRRRSRGCDELRRPRRRPVRALPPARRQGRDARRATASTSSRPSTCARPRGREPELASTASE